MSGIWIPTVFLINLFCLQDMSDLIVVPALGRPLQLGAFYSLYDEASLGHDLLNLQNLESRVTSAPICQTQVKVFSSENFEDKAKVLGFSDGMKLSVLSNLVSFLIRVGPTFAYFVFNLLHE